MQAPGDFSHNFRSQGKDDSGEFGSLEEPSIRDVSDQIALESGHAVRYRTCSWQKVNTQLERRSRLALGAHCSQDRRVTVFRIYMLGYPVIPVVGSIGLV